MPEPTITPPFPFPRPPIGPAAAANLELSNKDLDHLIDALANAPLLSSGGAELLARLRGTRDRAERREMYGAPVASYFRFLGLHPLPWQIDMVIETLPIGALKVIAQYHEYRTAHTTDRNLGEDASNG